MQKKTDRVFSNPFSEAFLPTWDLWKEFRWEAHSFKYKGVISEQMAINRLVEVAEGEEEKAERIIKQSISRGWMDFYKLKQPSNNGKSTAKQSTPKSQDNGQPAYQDRCKDELIDRFRKGQQSSGSDHLKAV